jgi:hypothetical protein
MAKSVQSRGIPTELSLEQFRQFVLPHLTVGSRGPAPKLSLHALFNYILTLLDLLQKSETGQSLPTISMRRSGR